VKIKGKIQQRLNSSTTLADNNVVFVVVVFVVVVVVVFCFSLQARTKNDVFGV